MELIDPELKKCLAKDDMVGIRTNACDNYENKDNNLCNRFLKKNTNVLFYGLFQLLLLDNFYI